MKADFNFFFFLVWFVEADDWQQKMEVLDLS